MRPPPAARGVTLPGLFFPPVAAGPRVGEGRGVERLEYEVYHPLARSEGERVMDEARQRWAFHRAACVHREGMLELGDMAVIVGVA